MGTPRAWNPRVPQKLPQSLHQQWVRAWSEWEAALDDAKNAAQGRYYWVLAKKVALDNDHVMVFDAPDMQEGGQMRFADLKNTAERRWLTQEEI